MSKALTAENFGVCMRLAFEHNVQNAIWRGLAFAAENPDNSTLKKLVPTFNLFASLLEKQLGQLIELGKECLSHKIIPSISPRDQRKIRLECRSFDLPANRDAIEKRKKEEINPDQYKAPKGKISQKTLWDCLQKIQALAPVEELDSDNYELEVDAGWDKCEHDNNHFRFIRQASTLLPTLKEIQLSFNKSKFRHSGFDPKNPLSVEAKDSGKPLDLMNLIAKSFNQIDWPLVSIWTRN